MTDVQMSSGRHEQVRNSVKNCGARTSEGKAWYLLSAINKWKELPWKS
jgi:hypothetical protein